MMSKKEYIKLKEKDKKYIQSIVNAINSREEKNYNDILNEFKKQINIKNR